MVSLVEMDLIKSGDKSDPKDGINFIEQIMEPTLAVCVGWKGENRILAGGPVSGSSKLVFIMKVESTKELDLMLMTLPLWAVRKRPLPLSWSLRTVLLTFAEKLNVSKPYYTGRVMLDQPILCSRTPGYLAGLRKCGLSVH